MLITNRDDVAGVGVGKQLSFCKILRCPLTFMKSFERVIPDDFRFAMPTGVYEGFWPIVMPTVRIPARIHAVCYAH